MIYRIEITILDKRHGDVKWFLHKLEPELRLTRDEKRAARFHTSAGAEVALDQVLLHYVRSRIVY